MEHFENNAAHIARCITEGGVALIPTDTVYGLAVSPRHPKSVEALFKMKRRPASSNLPILVADLREISELGLSINWAANALLRSHLVPGALTLALGFSGDARANWLEGRDEVAVRIPDHKPLLEVLQLTGPLLVTSANIHGSPTPNSVHQILAQLDGSPAISVDGGLLEAVPSTLVNCHGDKPVLEREGVISESEIRRVLGVACDG